jgi:hypothetical protein
MRQFRFSRGPRVLGLCGIVTVVLAAAAGPAAVARPPVAGSMPTHPVVPAHPAQPAHPAPAPAGGPPLTPGDTSACTTPVLSQAFLWARDRNWYTLVPGQAPGSFTGAGWTLSGGAHVVSTGLKDEDTGAVLDLPSGARAVSPAICITSDDPAARAMVRNVAGAQGIAFYISYAGRRTWARPQKTGQFHGRHGGWTPSTRINLLPSHRTSGWQIVRFAFVAAGKTSDFQVYDFYVDPRMKA